MARHSISRSTLSLLALALCAIAPWAALGQGDRPAPAAQAQTPEKPDAPRVEPEIKMEAGSFIAHPRYLSRFSHAPLSLRIKRPPPRRTADPLASPLDRLTQMRDSRLQQRLLQLRQETSYAPKAKPPDQKKDGKEAPKIKPTPLYRMPGAEEKK